jgi:hypothetical protein
MAETLCFVQASGSSGEARAAEFENGGWIVERVDPSAEDAIRTLESSQPVATVFCLEPECGPTLEFAVRVLEDSSLHRPLMVFVGGDASAVEAAKQTIPFGVFVSSGELPWVLKRLVFHGE